MKKTLGLLLLCLTILMAGTVYAKEQPTFGVTAMVNNPNYKDKLFLRPSPSKDGAPLGLYYNGTDAKVVEILPGSDWVKVQIGSIEGYMLKEYLAFGKDCGSVFSMNPVVKVMCASPSDRAPLYQLPSTDSWVMATFPIGSAINVLGVGPEWIHVWVDGVTGFMPVNTLSSVDEAAASMSGFYAPRWSALTAPSEIVQEKLYEKTISIHPSMPDVDFSMWGYYDESGLCHITQALITAGVYIGFEVPDYFFEYADDFLLFEDVNFDGYLDFAVCRSVGAHNHFYEYWLWDALEGRYVHNQSYNEVLASYPIFIPELKQIQCFYNENAATSYDFLYQVSDGLPVMIEKRETVYQNEKTKRITLWKDQNGTLVKVDTWTETD